MKSKSKMKSILMLFVLLSMFAYAVKPALAQTASLQVLPLPPVPNYYPGRSFYFDIYVQDVTDLKSFDLTLSFNASLLTITNSSINTIDPVSQISNGFKIFPINDTNQAMGYIELSADRGPSGQITNEFVGTGDGSNTVFFLANPRILSKATTTVRVGGIATTAYSLDPNTGRIIFNTSPALNAQIRADYIHPGLTTADLFWIVEIGFNVTDRGTCPMDITASSLIDIYNSAMTYDVVNTVFDNRFQGHLTAPNYVNGALMAGDEFDIVIDVSNVLIETQSISFYIDYDTNVLTAISGGKYIDDTAGWVYVELEHLSLITVDPIPLTSIHFGLDANGYSPLRFREVTAVATSGLPLIFDATNGSVSTLHDVAVTNVTPLETQVGQGNMLPINVTVANQGNFTETFDVTAFYNSTAIVPSQTVTALASGENTTLTFNWDTTGIAYGNYTIKAVASTVPSETDTSDNTLIDGTVKIVLGPTISLNPTSGPAGTKLEVSGIRFGAFDHITVYFDDMPMAEVDANSGGTWTAVFNVPLAEPGAHVIKAVGPGAPSNATFKVIDTSQMDINIEVGQTHFRGEIAEFYIQTAFKGEPVDATSLTATLRKPDGTTQTLTNQHITTGLYKAPYTFPTDAPTGTYVLVIEADYATDTIESKGTKISGFLLSPTLTDWNAMLININGTVATIKTDVGLIKTDITTINIKITAINGTVATIKTDVGTILGQILTIQGDVATIKTDIGTIKTTIQGWTGGTVSDIVTPNGTFNLLTLTTSTLEHLAYSEKTITVIVSGPAGTTGTTNVVLPKQFLAGIGTAVEQIEVTINDKQVDVTHSEDADTYVLSIGYTHSTHTIKIFLAGIPPQPPLSLTTILLIIIAVIAAAAVIEYYRRRARKKTVNV